MEAADKRPNIGFWRRIYKKEDGSGGPFISGWILTLYPKFCKDVDFDKYYPMKNKMIKTDKIPLGVSKVPFIWIYGNEKLNMLFAGGFIGLR